MGFVGGLPAKLSCLHPQNDSKQLGQRIILLVFSGQLGAQGSPGAWQRRCLPDSELSAREGVREAGRPRWGMISVG